MKEQTTRIFSNFRTATVLLYLFFTYNANSQQCQLVKACQNTQENIDVLFSVGNKASFTITDASQKSSIYFEDGDSTTKSIPLDGKFVDLFISLPDKVFFTVKQGNYKSIWITKGINETKKLIEFRDNGGQNDTVGLFLIGTIENKTYFIVHRYTDSVWVTDGTVEGTKNTGIDLKTKGQYFLSIKLIDQFDDKILFIYHNTSYQNLFISDGTVQGTTKIHSFDKSYKAQDIFKCDNKYFTKVQTDDLGEELYKIDFDSSKFVLIKDIVAGKKSSNISNFFNIRDTLFFTRGNVSRELWKSDGTPEGTQKVTLIPQVDVINLKSQFIPFKDKYYFVGDDELCGSELWVTDGTPIGTKMVMEINKGGSTAPIEPFVLNDYFYFSADDGIHGRQLWVTDGTESGTRMVKDLKGSMGSFPANIYGFKNILFFTINNGEFLYSTDGTENGTSKLAKRYSTPFVSIGFSEFTEFRNRVYFQSVFLWNSDGTPEGTNKFLSPYNDDNYGVIKILKTAENLFCLVYHGDMLNHISEIWKLDLATSVKSENVNSLTVFPNPVNDISELYFNLDISEKVSIDIYNILGTKVASVINNSEFESGNHSISLNTKELEKGIFFVKLQLSSGKFELVKFIK